MGMSNVVFGSCCTDVVLWVGIDRVAGGEYGTGWLKTVLVEGTDGVCEWRREGTVRRECRRFVSSGAELNPVTVDIASIAVTFGS